MHSIIRRHCIALLVMFFGSCWAMAAPPKVVKATPDNGAQDIDPATRQIVVVFDQPMDHRGRSIVGGGDSFPEIVGQPTWSNDRTIVINVKLKPDHDYWLSINNQNFKNFTNKTGESAIPYPIAFSTSAGKVAAADKLTPELNKKAIEELRKFIDDDYSYKDLRGIDWDKLFRDNAAALEKADTPSAFARQAGQMLAAAKDIHLFLKVGDRTFPSARRSIPGNLNIKTLQKVVPQWKENNGVATGKFEDGVTYVFIGAWSEEIRQSLDPVYAAIGTADPKKGIIIDVRANSGGSEDIAQEVAGCFVAEPKLYSKDTIRHDSKTDGPFDRMVEPNHARPSYRGPVAVLIGKYCMSSNESFILMMKAAGATLVGETTYGSSGNPRPHELSNGVTILLPSWKDMRPDGTCLEGEGVKPDIEVKTNAGEFEARDPILEAALKVLRK